MRCARGRKRTAIADGGSQKAAVGHSELTAVRYPLLNPIRHPQQLQGMRGSRAMFQSGLNLPASHRTVARVEIGARISDAAHDRPADLHGDLAKLALHAVRAVVSRATLDGLDLHAGREH